MLYYHIKQGPDRSPDIVINYIDNPPPEVLSTFSPALPMLGVLTGVSFCVSTTGAASGSTGSSTAGAGTGGDTDVPPPAEKPLAMDLKPLLMLLPTAVTLRSW